MAGHINQDVCLADDSVGKEDMAQLSMTHPFEITVDHSLTVHVDQAPRDVGQLWEPRNRQQRVRTVGAGM